MSSSDLCRRCGLCCDGNLFSHVPLEHAEVDAARRQGLEVVRLAGARPPFAKAVRPSRRASAPSTSPARKAAAAMAAGCSAR
ncbi:hypothetical protein ACN28S_47425 [Cystobacter fuscus]